MLPVGSLMVEHRLIERLINMFQQEQGRIAKKNTVNLRFVDFSIDFLKTYADKCHHGKEEEILFRELSQKPLSIEHKELLDRLIQDHILGRKMVMSLSAARDRYACGDRCGLNEITGIMRDLAQFYSQHIEKEDKKFFLPVMEYFTKQEQARMLANFREFDQRVIHEHYKDAIEQWQGIGL